jgi:hypothetical protein
MVRLFYDQLDGLAEGWKVKTRQQSGSDQLPADFDVIYGMRFINYIADIFDYLEKFKAQQDKEEVGEAPKASKPSCTVLIKHLPGSDELYVGHNTWHEYRAMGYRVLKKYSLPYRRLPDSQERVPGHTITMSSWPATIFSLDDFMTISSGLVATETSLFVYDSSLYSAARPERQVLEPARVMAASRLARGGGEWTELASRHNSGTYNNQWMVVDHSRVGGGRLEAGALWVLEQMPGRTWAGDQTAILRARGYWASYNRAFYPEAFRLSGAPQLVAEHGSWFSHGETPRARILARDQGAVTDEGSMMALMRYNDFQQDPLAVVPGCPLPIPAGSLASRCDLTLPGSECSWQALDYMVGHQGYGALDAKVTSRRLAATGDFWAVAGPTHGPAMPPFDWRTTNLTSVPTHRPIERFDFQPAITHWRLQAFAEAIQQIG